MTDPRPGWDIYHMGFAFAAAVRADCTRRQVGAAIFLGDRLVGSGYNGAPPGKPGCLSAGACPRGRMSKTDVLPGSSYDTGSGACIALHAEQNAILRAGLECRGATLYITDEPCDGCARFIEGAGIARVVYPDNTSREVTPHGTPTRLLERLYR